MSDESFGEARAYEKDLSRPGAVAGTTAPSVRSKEDPAKRGLGREAETRQVRGRNAQPSARPESGSIGFISP